MREIHPQFEEILAFKEKALIELYKDLREYVLDLCPDSNELLYHTHALTSLYSVSDKMSTGFVMIPIYTNHLNLGFTKGTLLDDPMKLLQGSGKWIRHIPVRSKKDYRNENVKQLVIAALQFAVNDMAKPTVIRATTISKIR